ncbi:MAG: PLP-dependent aminotransferase family protein [Acidobacteriota bacterium]|jgi:2-aminoadipate transaminase|nr:PLP-dependent aminotransferase family protein [Acidobacteriota bacterium]
MSYEMSRLAGRLVSSEIRELLKMTRIPGVISFGGGLPDPALFPIDDIIAITADVLRKKGYLALQYGPTIGEPEFIEALVRHHADFGETVAPEQICVTSSSQQGIDLLTMLFLDENSPVVMELPSYLGTIQAFRRAGADMRGVPMDDQGMRIDRLEEILNRIEAEGKRARFIYVIPDFQNPAGVSLSLERRRQLLRIAAERQVPVVEDSPYRELTFKGEPLPSLWTLADGKGVIGMKTFSKMLFPGMRMGWIQAEAELTTKIAMLKQSVDLCTPSFTQLILSEFIRRGNMRKGIEASRKCYQPKLEAMLESLQAYMPAGVSWSTPGGGMFLWVRLPEQVDAKEIFPQAIENKVAYIIGRAFHCDGSGNNTLRLNYSFPSVEQIREGIRRLAEVVKKAL